MKELREKARIAIYPPPVPVSGARTPVMIATVASAPRATPTPRN
jgi:hypothetical protein